MEDSDPTNKPDSETMPRKLSHASADGSAHFFSAGEAKSCTQDGTTPRSSTNCEAVEDERAFEL